MAGYTNLISSYEIGQTVGGLFGDLHRLVCVLLLEGFLSIGIGDRTDPIAILVVFAFRAADLLAIGDGGLGNQSALLVVLQHIGGIALGISAFAAGFRVLVGLGLCFDLRLGLIGVGILGGLGQPSAQSIVGIGKFHCCHIGVFT